MKPALLVGATLLGVMACMPTRFDVAPYDHDAARATALADDAMARCVERRGTDYLPDRPFTSDGCSMWPDANWSACCIDHDMDYWCGGSATDRRRADDALSVCVASHASSAMAGAMRIGVIVGGIPWQPMPWRWGYGFAGIRGYED